MKKIFTLFSLLLAGISAFANPALFKAKSQTESRINENSVELSLPIDVSTPKLTQGNSSSFVLNTRAEELNYYLSGSFNDAVLGDENYKFSPAEDGSGNYVLEFNGTLTNTFLINTGSWDLFYATNGTEPIELGVPFQTDVNGNYYITTENKDNIIDAVLIFNPESGLLTITGEYQQPEYAYQIYSNFLYDFGDFIPQENGTWTFSTDIQGAPGQFYILKINNLDKALISYIYATVYEYIDIDQPLVCSETSGYPFNILPGEYTLIFDPESLTLKAEGQISQETFYLENPVVHKSYQLEETEDGSGIFTCPSGINVLFTGYYVRSNYGRYFGSNGSELIPGEVYQTNFNYDPINTVEKKNIDDVDVKFIPQTGELTINGSLLTPAIAIFGNIFFDPSEGEKWGMYPVMNRNGVYKTDVPIEIFGGDFTILMYDPYIGIDADEYCFWGPDIDLTPISLNQLTQCYNNQNTFKIEQGSYNFAFDLETRTLLVTEEDAPAVDAYLIETGSDIYADGAEISFNIFPLNLPTEISDFTVYYRQQNEPEYKSFEVSGNNFTLPLEGLNPDSEYVYEIYATANSQVSEYRSEVLEYEFRTPEIEVDITRSQVQVTDSSLSFNYSIQSNLIGDYVYELYYALIPNKEESDIDDAYNADYEVSYLTEKEGVFTVENLSPSTNYIMYYVIEVKVGDAEGGKGIYYLLFSTEESSFVNEISSSKDSKAIYYDLQGRRIDNPSKGIFIEVNGSKTRKVVIR